MYNSRTNAYSFLFVRDAAANQGGLEAILEMIKSQD